MDSRCSGLGGWLSNGAICSAADVHMRGGRSVSEDKVVKRGSRAVAGCRWR